MDEDNKKIPDGTEGNDWIDQLLQEVKNENEGEASPKAPSQPLHPSAPPVQRALRPKRSWSLPRKRKSHLADAVPNGSESNGKGSSFRFSIWR